MPDVDETFEQFFREKISEEMFEYWVIPMFETMCAYKGDDVSRKAFPAMMVSYLNADSVKFRDGIGILPKALAGYVNVELTAQVKGIRLKSDGSGAEVTYTVQGQTKTVSAERLVVAVPGNHALLLFEDPRAAWCDFFPKVAYSTGALHYHIFDMAQHPDELAAQAQEVMCTIFPALKGTFRAHRIFKWQGKLPAFRPGYLEALKRFWEKPTGRPGLLLRRLLCRSEHRRRLIYRDGMCGESTSVDLKSMLRELAHGRV